ncbi:MAG: hypothetical protein ACOCUF_03390 [Patescibacteria group bacterium]
MPIEISGLSGVEIVSIAFFLLLLSLLFLKKNVTKLERKGSSSEKEEENKSDQEDERESKVREETKKVEKKDEKGSKFPTGILIFIILIVILIGGFYWYERSRIITIEKVSSRYADPTKLYFELPLEKGDTVKFISSASFKVEDIGVENISNPIKGIRVYLGSERKTQYIKGEEVTIPEGTRFIYNKGKKRMGFFSEQKPILKDSFQVKILKGG